MQVGPVLGPNLIKGLDALGGLKDQPAAVLAHLEAAALGHLKTERGAVAKHTIALHDPLRVDDAGFARSQSHAHKEWAHLGLLDCVTAAEGLLALAPREGEQEYRVALPSQVGNEKGTGEATVQQLAGYQR